MELVRNYPTGLRTAAT